MEWFLANWGWASPIVIPIALFFLKRQAKKTPNVLDDKIVTFLAGIWDVYKGREPRKTTGKVKKTNSKQQISTSKKKYSEKGEDPEI